MDDDPDIARVSRADLAVDLQHAAGVWTCLAMPLGVAGPVAGWVKLLRVHA